MLGIAAPVLADYLGPNRTVTTTVPSCHWVKYRCAQQKDNNWEYHSVDSWLCSDESKPWEGCSKSSPPCNETNSGHTYCERQDGTETTTVTYPVATIEGSIQNCTLYGEWCNGTTAPQLALSANEPVQGYSVTLIEGTLNGVDFACQPGATSCNIPLNEGKNDFAYWAHSSWGDTSDKGMTSIKVDTVAPSVSLDIQGTPGANNWYVSAILVTATGSDPTPGSGVTSALLSLDGGAIWQPSVTLNEGVYNLVVQVLDNAGNVSTSSATLSVDTTTPSINLSVTGTAGNNGWYKSVVQVSAIASDATSGVASSEVSIDGAAYQAYTNTTPVSFSDGQHTIRFCACDTAGNCTETPLQTYSVDTQAPTVDLPRSWPFDKNVDYTAQDTVSGLAALRVVIEDEDEKFAKVTWDEPVSGMTTFSDNIHWNGVFKDKTKAPPGMYLVWVKASDKAGNERFQLGKAIVPEPNYVWILPEPNAIAPTEAAVAPPSPPAELLEGATAPSLTTPPTTGFGGGATQPGEARRVEPAETTKQSVLLTSGTGGAASAATTSSGILWGAAAAAAIGAASAYAFEATRKRKEAEEAQAAQARAEMARPVHLSKSEKAERAQAHEEKVKERKEQQSWDNPAQEKAKLKEQAERDAAYQQWLQQQRLEQQLKEEAERQAVADAAQDKRVAAKYDAQENANWLAVQAALRQKQEDRKMEEAAARDAQMRANLPGLNSEKQYKPKDAPLILWDKLNAKVEEAKKTVQDLIASAVTAAQQHNDSYVTTAQSGGLKVAAAPALEDDPGDFWHKLWNGIKNGVTTVLNSVFGQPKPSTKPVQPDVKAIATQALQTVAARFTQTAQAMPTSTPTFIPSPTLTPTPSQDGMWVTFPAYLRSEPFLNNNPLTLLPVYSEVRFTGQTKTYQDPSNGQLITFYQVVMPNGQSGWAASNFLESTNQSNAGKSLIINPNKNVFINPSLKPSIELKTHLKLLEQDLGIGHSIDLTTNKAVLVPTPTINFNLCGEFSSAYVTGQPVDTLITDWINQADAYWQARARDTIRNPDAVTGIDDLMNMLNMHNCSYQDFLTPLTEPITNGPLVTPGRLKAVIDQGNSLIVGVSVNKGTGALNQGDTPHWVVLDDVLPQGVNGGQVLIYNSMPNTQEVYTYDTFLKASTKFSESVPDVILPNGIRVSGLWVDLSTCK